MIIDSYVSIEPPGLDFEEGDEDRPTVMLVVWITEADGCRRNSAVLLDADTSDDEIAASLIACLRGCASMRGPGLVAAVQRLLR